ncbi:hypothetical protein [uncultured Lutibacter sp.]|uniref:hypothetical protein n=1 Tax=uncultured Lutibacter sp. TaxID=437739 RepID=UPI002623ABC2|nr:hypothetical protein [uncultured Lutibacter sp.]
MSIKVLQLHKRASYEYKHIQDKYAISSDNNVFALADGTTQSFNSELWAEIITKEFVNEPNFSPQTLISQFKESVSAYKNAKFEFSSNPAKASLERAKHNKGGTATFIGIRIKENSTIEVISCGDTNLFLLNSENKIRPFPFSDINSLDANNSFINTETLLQNSIDESFFKNTSLSFSKSDTIILATDALSRLILKNPNTINDLLRIPTFENLLDFCLKKWETKELEEDDISAIIITHKDHNDIQLICPPIDFEFPKEKEEEFIPTSLTQDKPTQNSYMEMNEIRNQFNGVAKDMHHVKTKLKLHEILLMVTISLLMVNMLMTYLLRPKVNQSISEQSNPTNVIEKKYDETIKGLQSEIKSIKNKISETITPNESKENDNKTEDNNKEITKDEAKKRQQELIKAGYKLIDDGIWGDQSEKAWQEYQSKKSKK